MISFSDNRHLLIARKLTFQLMPMINVSFFYIFCVLEGSTSNLLCYVVALTPTEELWKISHGLSPHSEFIEPNFSTF